MAGQGEVGRIRRTSRRSAAPREAIGDIARRRKQAPSFNIDVGRPAELGGEPGMQGTNLGDLVDLNPDSFAQEPAMPSGSGDEFYKNLLGTEVSIAEATRIVEYLDEQLERHKDARRNQDKIIARGIQETGYDRQDDTRTSPFPGASAVVHPLFAQSAVDFASRAIKRFFPAKGPILTTIQGTQSDEALQRAGKVRRFLNWLLTQRCRSYRGEQDKLLTMLPFSGDAIKKLYWDDTEQGFGRPRPEFVLPDKFIVPYSATDLEECPIYAHEIDLWPERVADLMDGGRWRKVPINRSAKPAKSQQKDRSDRIIGIEDTDNLDGDQITFREVHVDWYFSQLKQANDKYKLDAAKKPPAPPPQQLTSLQPASGQPQLPPSPDGHAMVDLGGALDQARAQMSAGGPPKPETDPDSVDLADAQGEVAQEQKGGDDQERVDRPQFAGFPGGPKLPYIITYHYQTKEPVCIYRNWKRTDANQKKRTWFSHFVMFPWRGFNGLGMWHLIGGLAKAATGTLRAILDSAVIDNMPGGVRLANSRMSGDDITYRPMEFAKIQAPGINDIRSVLMPYPKNPTAPVLLELLKAIVSWGQNFATIATQEIVEMPANTPATTVLQIFEHAGAIYSAIHARLHAAQEREFELLAELTAEHLPEEGFAFSDEQGEEVITKADFENVKIKPVSDPDTFSEMQRSIRGQAALDLVSKAKELGVNVDARHALVFFAETLNLPELDKLFPAPPQAQPRDPVSELYAVIRGTPCDAFPGQNHKAHVAFMKAIAANPQYQMMLQPNIAAFAALGQAHTMMMLRDELEEAAGAPMPLNQPLPPQAQHRMAEICAQVMNALTDRVLKQGIDPILQFAGPMGMGAAGGQGAPGAPGAGGDQDMQAFTEVEREKARIAEDKNIMDDTQKDNEHARKMAEVEAGLHSKERIALLQDMMEDRRTRREMAAKLIIHFTGLTHDANESAEARSLQIAQSTTDTLNKVFDDINARTEAVHKQVEAARGRAHEHRGKVLTAENEALQRALGDKEAERERAHQASESQKTREHEARQADAAAKAASTAARKGTPKSPGGA